MAVKLNLSSNHNIFRNTAAKRAEKKEDTKAEKTSKEDIIKIYSMNLIIVGSIPRAKG